VALERLLARDREIARAWVAALVLTRPLEEIAELPMQDLAAEAPAMCAQALRALGSDSELDRLAAGEGSASAGRDEPAGGRSFGALLCASDPPAAVAAAEALRGVLWEALLDELSRPAARLIADLADRLACVCATILAAALAEHARGAERAQRERSTEWELEPAAGAPQGRRPAAIIDELQGDVAFQRVAEEAAPGSPAAAERTRAERTAAERTAQPPDRPAPALAPRPLPWDVPAAAADGLRVRRSARHPFEALDESG
jgi:hypothetical protein